MWIHFRFIIQKNKLNDRARPLCDIRPKPPIKFEWHGLVYGKIAMDFQFLNVKISSWNTNHLQLYYLSSQSMIAGVLLLSTWGQNLLLNVTKCRVIFKIFCCFGDLEGHTVKSGISLYYRKRITGLHPTLAERDLMPASNGRIWLALEHRL